MIDVAVTELEPFTSVKRACELLGKSRATLHRQRNPEPAAEKAPPGPRAPHPAALTGAEQAALLAVLDSERFADKSPAQVYAILLDDGIYLASIRTMYRVMTLADQVRERRAQAAHPPRVRPELVADGPDQMLLHAFLAQAGAGTVLAAARPAGRGTRRCCRRSACASRWARRRPSSSSTWPPPRPGRWPGWRALPGLRTLRPALAAIADRTDPLALQRDVRVGDAGRGPGDLRRVLRR